MIRQLFIIVVLVFVVFSGPARSQRLFTEMTGSRDSDDETYFRLLAGYRRTIVPEGKSELEIAGGVRSYSGHGETRDFDVARLGWSSRTERGLKLRLNWEFLRGKDWEPHLPSTFLSYRVNPKWYFEFSASRDVVDSVRAVNNRISFDSYVASADYRVSDRWTLVGAWIDQRFSEDNRKHGGLGRIIFSPEEWTGFHVELKGRYIAADQDSPYYFSPETLQEEFLLFGYATPFADDDWVVKVIGGPGIQHINPFTGPSRDKDAYFAEVSLRGWFRERIQLESRLGCTSANETTEAYRYCFGKLHLGYAW